MEELNDNQEVEQKHFWLEAGGYNLQCTPENAFMFLHDDDHEQFDYIFLVNDFDIEELEDVPWWKIYRQTLPDFEEMMLYMVNQGYEVNEQQQVEEIDREEYYNQNPLMKGYHHIDKKSKEACKKMGDFVAWLAEKGRL